MPRTGHLDWYPWPSARPRGEGQPGPVPSEVSSGLLCCVVSCCAVLCCVVLCCVVLCCAVLCCVVLWRGGDCGWGVA